MYSLSGYHYRDAKLLFFFYPAKFDGQLSHYFYIIIRIDEIGMVIIDDFILKLSF